MEETVKDLFANILFNIPTFSNINTLIFCIINNH